MKVGAEEMRVEVKGETPHGLENVCFQSHSGYWNDLLIKGIGDARSRSRSPANEPTTTSSVRQRSPPRGPRLSRSKDRERNRDRDRDRKEPPPSSKANGASTKGSADSHPTGAMAKSNGEKAVQGMDLDNPDEEDADDAVMRKIMGFAAFKSTQNTKVPGNDKNYGVRKEKKTEYRQYMNRTGGFNRPLSPG